MAPTWTIAPPTNVVATWPLANNSHPQRRGPAQYVVTGVFGSIMAFAVLLRLYTRIFVRRYFGLDDALIIVAFLSAIGVICTSTLGSARFEWDRHLWDADLRNTRGSLINLYLSRTFWGISSSCVRLSILCLYYRLLARCEAPRRYRWILHGVTIFTVGFLIELLVTGLIPCLPVHSYWDFRIMQSTGQSFKCINDFKSMQQAAIINTSSEFVIALLPFVAVFAIKVDTSQRWNVISLLSLGFLVVIAGIVRSYYLWKIADTFDLTWWAGPHWICAEVEIDVALTCACVAPLRPVFGRLIKRLQKTSDSIASLPVQIKNITKDQQWSASTTSSNGRAKEKFSGVSMIDEDDRNAWVSQMSRTIDLEGIAEDGFGYSVTIMGPPRKQSRVRRVFDRKTSTARDDSQGVELRSAGSRRPSRARKGSKQSEKRTFERRRSEASPVCWEGTMQQNPAHDLDSQVHVAELREWDLLDSPQAYDSH